MRRFGFIVMGGLLFGGILALLKEEFHLSLSFTIMAAQVWIMEKLDTLSRR